MNPNIVYLVALAALAVAAVYFLKGRKAKKAGPEAEPAKPEVKPAPTPLDPEAARRAYLESLPASTRAFYDPNRVTPEAVAIDYSGFDLVNSGYPKRNAVKAGQWVTFNVTVTKPSQSIQASCQNAVTLDEEIAGVSRHRQASNPTALNLKLLPGSHAYKVRCDRDGDLVVKFSEW